MEMKNSYFSKVWQANKLLFGALSLFIIGQFFFTYKGVETLPFFNYGMYSAPIQQQKTYTTISLYNETDTYVNLYTTKAPRFWQYQLAYYSSFVKNNYQDPTLVTIYQRFGKSTLSAHLTKHLCNDKSSALHLSEFLIQKIKIKESKICRENFKWVKSNFKKVNSIQLN